jgi:hypothetical protein
MIERRLRGLNPGLVELYRGRIGEYERITAGLVARAAADGPPWVQVIRPTRGAPSVSQLERDAAALEAAASAARTCAEAALGGG